MRQVTINLNKMARGTLCRQNGCKCITGHILHSVLGVKEEKLVEFMDPKDISRHSPAHIKSWINKHYGTLSSLIHINDSCHDNWEIKKEKMRPLIRQLGVAARFIR